MDIDYKKLYNETLQKLHEMVSKGIITEEVAKGICADFAVESEDEKIRQFLIHEVEGTSEEIMSYRGMNKESVLAWLKKQGKHNMGISEDTKQKLEDNLNKALEKETPESWNKFLEQGEQKPIGDINGEDYGIDGLWHAQHILERTLGEVEGYQSDDGILEHKCAITAVRDLAKKQGEQNPASWSEEDEDILNTIINHFKVDIECTDEDDTVRWLKSLKDRVQPQPKQEWKPSDDEMKALAEALSLANNCGEENAFDLRTLYEQLKKLKQEQNK